MNGSIEARGPNTWRLIISAGTNSRGKRAKITRTVHGTRREAEKMLAKLTHEVHEGEVAESLPMTVADWAAIWLQNHVDVKLAGKTRTLYHFVFRTRIIPALGHIPLDQLTPQQIMAFVKNLGEAGVRQDGRKEILSPASISRHLCILATCLQAAVYHQRIRNNPARNIKAPGREAYQRQNYSEAQVCDMLQALAGETPRLRAMILLALTTGLRRRELVALEWSHLDRSARSLRICQSAGLQAGSAQRVNEIRDTRSQRMVILPEVVFTALQDWQQEQIRQRQQAGALWQETPFIFVQAHGQWIPADEVTKQFRIFLKRHGLPIIPFHGLRYTAATLLIAQNLPGPTVANILGDHRISTTLNIYRHALESSNKSAAEMMDELLDRAMPPPDQTRPPEAIR